MKLSFLKNGLLRNTSALYLVQIANYIVPLVILPFLTRKLGKESYGELATLQAVAAYGLVIVDYGFQISATRKLAAMLERDEDVSEIYTQVMAAKIVLSGIALAVMCLAVAILPYLALTWSFAAALVVLALGNALTPLWLFQGFERMGLLSMIMLASRIGTAAFTLLLVKSPQDVDLALWAQAIGVALPAVFALWQASRLIPALRWPSISGVRAELSDGWSIFQTAIFSSLLTNSGVLILGVTAGAQVAGGYAAVERVAKGIASMSSPVTQAIYPRVSASFARSYKDGLNVIRRFGMPLLGLSGILAGVAVVIALWGGIEWLFGAEYEQFAGALFVLALWMVLGVSNNILGIQYLTNIGQQKWYATAFTISSLTALGLFLVLSRVWSYWGIACGLVFGEVLLLILLVWRVLHVGRKHLGGVEL